MTDRDSSDADKGGKTLSELQKQIEQLRTDAETFKSDNYKLREKNRELSGRFESLEHEKKTLEEQRLKDGKDWKTLYEQSIEKIKGQEARITSFEERERGAKKNSALLKELSKYGFDSQYTTEAFKLIDTKSVNFDEESGIVYGAETVVKDFHSKYQNFPMFTKKSPGVNQNGQTNGSPRLDVTTMTKAEMKKYFEEKQKRGRS